MTRHQKVVLASLFSAIVVLLVVVALLNLGDDGSGHVSAGTTTSSSSTTETTDTTVELAPVQASTPTTAKPAAPAPTAPPTTAAPQPVVGPSGAILQPPKAPDVRTMTDSDCHSLGSGGPGWTSDCGQVAAKGGVDLVWLVERRSGGGTRSAVLRHSAANQWVAVLVADDPSGSKFAAVNVAVADSSGDGKLDIGFGFRLPGMSHSLAVDLVEGPGRVVVHQDLAQGSARMSTGQLNTWAAAPDSSIQVIKQVIRYVGGAWRITSSTREPTPAPTSQL